ncbi:MAG: 4Fe-4S dicluster domain-containing protein [Chloroflexi bacterium]|nr:4Fe-4S dicluster domain-containing protein [Chloroflexota bacterium]
MTWSPPTVKERQAFLRQIEERCAQELMLCYQCGKCTAGCPVAFSMDYPPHQIMRGVQLGMRDTVLRSNTIWLCAACETCSTRCPQGVDVAAVMDALRQIALLEGVRSSESDVPLFHRLFLASIQRHGRVFETTMLGLYNVLSGHYFKDVLMAPKMLAKRKLGFLPPKRGNTQKVREAFRKARELERQLG